MDQEMTDKINALEEHVLREDKRLDRIEAKIDKLAETVVAIARAEEKLIQLETDRHVINDRLAKHSDRLDDLEEKVDETSVTVKIVNRIFWIFVAAVISAGAAGYFNLVQ